MIYILYGQDDFSLQEELGRIRSSLNDEMLGINTTYLEAVQTTPQEVINASDTVPFLGRYRIVIVNGLLRRFETPQRGRERPSPAPDVGPWRALIDYVNSVPESTILVFTDGPLSGPNRLFEALRPLAKTQEFRALRPNALPGWIGRRARDKGVSISPAGIRLLAMSLGTNLWALDRELDKLACYPSQRPLDEDDVRTLVGPARDISVFSLVDAVVERKAPRALALLRQLQSLGAEGGHVLFMLTRQYRLLLLTKEMREEGASAEAIGQQIGINNEFIVRKIIEQAGRTTLAELKVSYRRLLGADLAIKRGQQGEELALDLLTIELARGPGT